MQRNEKFIIFCGSQASADDLSSDLALLLIPCQSIYTKRSRTDRVQAMAEIIDACVKVLIAVDIVSHGIDIEDVTHVINYDFPHQIEEYVHVSINKFQ